MRDESTSPNGSEGRDRREHQFVFTLMCGHVCRFCLGERPLPHEAPGRLRSTRPTDQRGAGTRWELRKAAPWGGNVCDCHRCPDKDGIYLEYVVVAGAIWSTKSLRACIKSTPMRVLEEEE